MWRCFVVAFTAALLSCSQVERDNPADPGLNGSNIDDGILLNVRLPGGDHEIGGVRLADFRYEVSASDMAEPVVGTLNLVGSTAQAIVLNVPDGTARIFRVDAFDIHQVPTFAAAETLDVADGVPQRVDLTLERLLGEMQLTSQLPEEVESLEVAIVVDGDTLVHLYEGVQTTFNERLVDIPTGGEVPILVKGRDEGGQLIIEEEVQEDIRNDLLSHVQVSIVVGALQISAQFPQYLPTTTIDRFSDAAGFFFRRSETPDLPGVGEPIDFDDERFLHVGFGPNGGLIQFYHFDVRSKAPAPVFILQDSRDEEFPTQLAIFDLLPGDEGHSDMWRINTVKVIDRDYLSNSLTSLDEVIASGFEITETNQPMNAVMVPESSVALRRLESAMPPAPQDGWYKGQIVKYLLFENPNTLASITLDAQGDSVQAAQMFGFFENNRDQLEGFARERDTGATHNVISFMPSSGTYSPLWNVTILQIEFFDRVSSVTDALGFVQADETNIIPTGFQINAPVVSQ